MPIATKKLYIFKKCGYTTIKTVGDVIIPMDFITICPKCGADMEMDYNKEIRDTLFDVLKSIFKK